jgi:hypothetical protein
MDMSMREPAVWGHPFANIVPMQGQQICGKVTQPIGTAPAVGTPQLTYRGGPLIAQIKLFAIYWGSAWNSAPTTTQAPATPVTRQNLDRYLATLVSGPFMDLLSEYSVPGTSIGHGSLLGSAVAGPDPSAQIADSDVRTLIQQRLAAGELPAWDANTLYAILLPSGTAIQQGGSASCQAFCGYHDAILDASGAPQAYYAVLPYPDCAGCAQTGSGTALGAFDALTVVMSHEIAEAVTDPVPGTGWYDDQNGEIGDICAWQIATSEGYSVQQEWSNAAGSCVGPSA